MPYHNLGTSKRSRFGLEADSQPDPEPPAEKTVSGWIDALRDRGVKVINEA
jgi:hypothetical protein